MKVIKSCRGCALCKLPVSKELEFGGLKVTKNMKAHYFCLLFSETISQSGEDDKGILGFLASDIAKERNRSKSRQCCYCKDYGASCGCVNKFCNRKYHMPCGLNKNAQFNFNNFTSYCDVHSTISNIPVHIKRSLKNYKCVICLEQFQANVKTSTIVWADCCRADITLHRNCIKQLALSAGYFTKCPGCNNRKEFIQTIKFYGVFVPERDAAWELGRNAYAELYMKHNTCDVENCRSPRGRSYSCKMGAWKYYLCNLCGSFGTHKVCSKVERQFTCNTCSNVECKSSGDETTAVVKEADTLDEIIIVDDEDNEQERKVFDMVKDAPSTSKQVNTHLVERKVAKKSTTKLPGVTKKPKLIGTVVDDIIVIDLCSDSEDSCDSTTFQSRRRTPTTRSLNGLNSNQEHESKMSSSLITNNSEIESSPSTLSPSKQQDVVMERRVAMKSTTKLPFLKRKTVDGEFPPTKRIKREWDSANDKGNSLTFSGACNRLSDLMRKVRSIVSASNSANDCALSFGETHERINGDVEILDSDDASFHYDVPLHVNDELEFVNSPNVRVTTQVKRLYC